MGNMDIRRDRIEKQDPEKKSDAGSAVEAQENPKELETKETNAPAKTPSAGLVLLWERIGSPSSQAFIAMLAALFALLSAYYAYQGNKLSHCRDQAAALGPTLDFLNDFLREPHEKEIHWPLFHNLARSFGPAAIVRRTLKGPLSTKATICEDEQALYAKAKASAASGSPLPSLSASYIPGDGASVVGIQSGGSDGVSEKFRRRPGKVDDGDCLLLIAQASAHWLDSAPTKGKIKATAIAYDPSKMQRLRGGLFSQFDCKPNVDPAACQMFQGYLNSIKRAAYLARDQVMARIETCDID